MFININLFKINISRYLFFTYMLTFKNFREQLTISRVAVIEKILQMFQLIAQQPGNASLAMLPSILDFTFEHIMPMIQMDNHISDNTDLTSVVYSLFDR